MSLMVGVVSACGKPIVDEVREPAHADPARSSGGDIESAEISVTTRSPDALDWFLRGRELFESYRPDHAREALDQAIALDPEFALAHAYRGMTTFGADGVTYLERGLAMASAQRLPRAERLVIESLLLKRNRDRARAAEVIAELVRLAPGDHRAQMWHGHMRQDARDVAGALAAYTRVTEIEPTAATAHGYVASLQSALGRRDAAIAAAEQFVALAPDKPAARDLLGEVLLMAGELDKAEQAFRAALDRSPQFGLSWHGIAMIRCHRGDWAGCASALERARDIVQRPKDKLGLSLELAWAHLAGGDLDRARTTADAMREAAVTAQQTSYVEQAMLLHVQLLMAAGQRSSASARLDSLIRDLDTQGAREALGWAFVERVALRAAAGQADHARAALARLEALAGAIENRDFAYGLAYARGLVALAARDHQRALDEFERVTSVEAGLPSYSLRSMDWIRMNAAQKTLAALHGAGDKDAARAHVAAVTQRYPRGALYAYLRAQLAL